MEYFDNYDEKYPNLIIEIIEYFDSNNNVPVAIADKSVLGFCNQFKDGNRLIYNVVIINRICKKLCECGYMEHIRSMGGLGSNDNYMILLKNKEIIYEKKMMYYFNSIVYGFEYIYNTYKKIVVPLVCLKENGDYSVGSGFKYNNGIVTAKHCITDVKNLQIKGYLSSELEGKPIYVSDNNDLDLAFIETGKVEEPFLNFEDGKVLQEVLVMGYPKIPAFTDFLTAEKAVISCKASARLTPTLGTISAYGFEYLVKTEAMLITARIRGGNSGGPVINENGCLVGVACQIPDANPQNGDYDDLGYGIAVPVSRLNEIIEKKPQILKVSDGFYRDCF